jgi:alkylation response protein AidB-like acyl-CoA dehydrogenase
VSIDYNFERQQLTQVVARFMQSKSAEPAVRAAMRSETGYDPATWRQMAVDLGLQGLAIPESLGGGGASAIEQALVLEQMGRALLCAPYLSTVILAAGVLMASGDQTACEQYLPQIADGTLTATLAFLERHGSRDPAAWTTTAEHGGASWAIRGEKTHVLDGATADLICVAARGPDGKVGIFAVPGLAPEVKRTPLAAIDQTRRMASLTFAAAPARLIGTLEGGETTLGRALDGAVVALAAEQAGGARRALDMAVDYAKIRSQFGRPIGSFQAVKHRCADMLIDVESMTSAAYHGANAASVDAPDLSEVAEVVAAFCGKAYCRVAASNIQVHGGVGFTWEHPAHLYYRRARASMYLLGAPCAWHSPLLRGLDAEGYPPG